MIIGNMNRGRTKWSRKLKERAVSPDLFASAAKARATYPGKQKNKNSKQNIDKGEPEYIFV